MIGLVLSRWGMQGVSNKWVINRRRKHKLRYRRNRSHIGEAWVVAEPPVGEEEEEEVVVVVVVEAPLTRIGTVIEVMEEWELVGLAMDKEGEDSLVVEEGEGEVTWVKGLAVVVCLLQQECHTGKHLWVVINQR
jgi:hypothetical protein